MNSKRNFMDSNNNNSQIWNNYKRTNDHIRDEIAIYCRHLSTIVAMIFGVMVTLHTSSKHYIVEFLFLLSVFFYAVSLCLLLYGCKRNIVEDKETLANLVRSSEGENFQPGQSSEKTKNVDSVLYAGIVTFVIALILSFISKIIETINCDGVNLSVTNI